MKINNNSEKIQFNKLRNTRYYYEEMKARDIWLQFHINFKEDTLISKKIH